MASASIFQQYLKPPKSITEYGAELDAGEANQLSLAEARRKGVASDQAMKEQNAFKAALAGGLDLEAQGGLQQGLAVAPSLALDTYKKMSDARKVRAGAGKDEADAVKTRFEVGRAKIQQAINDVSLINDPDTYVNSIIEKQRSGEIPPETAATILRNMPSNPQEFGAYKEKILGLMRTQDQQLRAAETFLQTLDSGGKIQQQLRYKHGGGIVPGTQQTVDKTPAPVDQSVLDERKARIRALDAAAQGNMPAGSLSMGGGMSVPMPGGGAQPQAGPVASGAIPGNNYGNIRPIGGGPNSGFQTYDSPQAGMNAIIQNLQAYGQRGINTIERVISTWAPPTDKNDTPALIRRAAQILGVSPTQPLDMNNPATLNALGTAIILQEHGPKAFVASKLGPVAMTAVSQDPAQKLSPEAMTTQAAPENIRATPAQSAAAFVREQFVERPPSAGETNNTYRKNLQDERMRFERHQDALHLQNIKEKAKLVDSKPLTEGQAKAVLFGSRMTEASAIMDELSSDGTNVAVPGTDIGGGVGMGLTAVLSEPQQRLVQAQRNFVNAVLRRESGAVINPSEFDNAKKQYFPQPGESDAVKAQKRTSREVAIRGMLAEIPENKRGIIDDVLAPTRKGKAQPEKSQQKPSVGSVVDGYRFKGGNPADKNSWVKVP